MEKQFPAPGSKRGGLGGGRRETERVGALARAVEGGIIGRRAYIPHTQQTRCRLLLLTWWHVVGTQRKRGQ